MSCLPKLLFKLSVDDFLTRFKVLISSTNRNKYRSWKIVVVQIKYLASYRIFANSFKRKIFLLKLHIGVVAITTQRERSYWS